MPPGSPPKQPFKAAPRHRSGYRPGCLRSAALVGGYSDVALPDLTTSQGPYTPQEPPSAAKQPCMTASTQHASKESSECFLSAECPSKQPCMTASTQHASKHFLYKLNF
eukprot:775173-Pelagomonas_calceolata.AAC.1